MQKTTNEEIAKVKREFMLLKRLRKEVVTTNKPEQKDVFDQRLSEGIRANIKVFLEILSFRFNQRRNSNKRELSPNINPKILFHARIINKHTCAVSNHGRHPLRSVTYSSRSEIDGILVKVKKR